MNIDWQHDASPLPEAALADFPGATAIFDTAEATWQQGAVRSEARGSSLASAAGSARLECTA